jgi:ATP synthase protein I
VVVAGLALGCFSAWSWIAKEERAMREEEKDDDDA